MRIDFLVTLSFLVVCSNTWAQRCNTAVPSSAPDSRFSVQAGGAEVLDKLTGLVWQRCSLGLTWSDTSCTTTGNAITYNWANALQAAKNMGNGWRVPNIKELQSVVEEACAAPAINEFHFPGTGGDYWTSSPYGTGGSSAWAVNFYSGGLTYANKGYRGFFVRLVRFAQ